MECPNETELSSFLTGQLPPDRLAHVASHCEDCAICQGSLETLVVGSDTMVNALRQGMPNMPFVREEPCLSLVDRTLLEVDGPVGLTGVLHANDRVGQYEIVRLLGRGGMGAVYEARHLKLKRTVALKLLPDHRMWPEDIARFEREMASVGQLSHPNIVAAHDAGEVDGHHYLAMELLDGTDLSKLSRSHGPLSVGAACELIRQAAVGLQYAHENGLVHRDIKPSNLMLTSNSTVKVLDLGLARLQAKATDEDGPELTATGDMMGTIDYMASEQGDDSTRVGPAADIYSLGATLHKLLTGAAPYSGEGLKTMMQKMRALAMEDPPSISTRRTDLPKEVVALVDSMTRRNPGHRPETMAEVAQRLEPFADASALSTLCESSSSGVCIATAPTKVPIETLTPAASTPSGGKRWLTVLASVVIAAVLMFGLSQIRISTKSGDIVITIEGGVPVTITDETVTFKDPADGQPVTVEVDHDRKKIRLTKPGFETVTEDLEMKSEGQRISVRFEPKRDKEVEPPNDELNALLEMVNSHGGDAKRLGAAIELEFGQDHKVTLSEVVAEIKRIGIEIVNLTVYSEGDLKEFASYSESKTGRGPASESGVFCFEATKLQIRLSQQSSASIQITSR